MGWKVVVGSVVGAGLIALGAYGHYRLTESETEVPNADSGDAIPQTRSTMEEDDIELNYSTGAGGHITFVLNPDAYQNVREYLFLRNRAGQRVTGALDIADLLDTMDTDGDRRITPEEVQIHTGQYRETIRGRTRP